MKDEPLSKLTITKDGQQATQYKKVIDALPVFCTGKGFKFIDDVIWTNTKLEQAAFLLTYPNTTLWLNTYHVQIQTVGRVAAADQDGVCPLITDVHNRSHVFDPNLQEQLLSEYNLKCKLKLQEWSKLTSNKKSLITIITNQDCSRHKLQNHLCQCRPY